MLVGEVVTSFVSVAAIISTTVVAVRTVNRTARQDRVTSVYSEMLSCVIETFELIREMFLLLDSVSRNITFVDKKGAYSETAYDRLYKRGPEISKRFQSLMARHELLLPDEVFQSVRGLLDAINDAGTTAYKCVPRNGVYPEILTEKLEKAVQTLFEMYKKSLEVFRKHIGSNELTVFAGRPAEPDDGEESATRDESGVETARSSR
jgi:hypothetical protein